MHDGREGGFQLRRLRARCAACRHRRRPLRLRLRERRGQLLVLAFCALVALPQRCELAGRLLGLRRAGGELLQGALLRRQLEVLGDRVVGSDRERRQDGKKAECDADLQGPRQDDVAAFVTAAHVDPPLGEQVPRRAAPGAILAHAVLQQSPARAGDSNIAEDRSSGAHGFD